MVANFLSDIPTTVSLRNAVDLVIEKNKSIGYPPTILVRELKGLHGRALVNRCSKFFKSSRVWSTKGASC